jgi:beta-phosphoglucomutase family hydrolase
MQEGMQEADIIAAAVQNINLFIYSQFRICANVAFFCDIYGTFAPEFLIGNDMLKGAIFDMDGVLVDNMKIHMEAFSAIARRYGVAVDTYSVLGMAGKGNDEIFRLIFPADVVERVGTARLGEEKEAVYREMYAPLLAPTRGLMEFFDDLQAHGVRIAVGTSAPKVNMDFVFDGLGIRRRFAAIVNVDMVKRAKPDPEIYLRALEGLGLAADECLVFEDAMAGIEAARAAGIKVVALSTSIPASTLVATPGVALATPDFTRLDFATLSALLMDN